MRGRGGKSRVAQLEFEWWELGAQEERKRKRKRERGRERSREEEEGGGGESVSFCSYAFSAIPCIPCPFLVGRGTERPGQTAWFGKML